MNVNITTEQFDRAFAEFQVIGPRRCTPIEERWLETLPEVGEIAYPAIKAKCQEIENFAFNLAWEIVIGKSDGETEVKQLSEKYPFLTKDRLRQTWNQAMRFAMQ